MYRAGWIALLVSIGCVCQGEGQTGLAFDPFSGHASNYHFDLGRNLYPTTEAAERARGALDSLARRVSALAQNGPRSPRALLLLLATSDSLALLAGRQYAYWSLRAAVDSRDQVAQQRTGDIEDSVDPAQTRASEALSSYSPRQIAGFLAGEPRLRQYEYAFRLAVEEGRHRPRGDSAGVGDIEAQATSWGPALFQQSLGAIHWGTVPVSGGVLDVRRNGNEIRNHSDRAVREAGYQLGQAGIESRRDVFAFIITREAALRNALARRRGWADFPAQVYASGGLRTETVRGLLGEVIAQAEVNKQYERWRRQEIERDYGYDKVHPWDLILPPKGVKVPRLTIQDATAAITASAAPFDTTYRRELRALLDPANGRLDLVGRPNRVQRPGFSTGSVGYPSFFFQGQYEGFVDDVIVLAHEAGHAVQDMLMDQAGVLPRYASGPNYFTESFAILNELLLLEHLSSSAPDSIIRSYYRQRLLENGLELFRSAHESLLELQIYDSVANGRAPNADGIERMTQAMGARVSEWFGPGSERQLAWAQPIQFFTRPLYRFNYAVGKLLALRYLAMYHSDPQHFRETYGALLRNGYSRPPSELLQRVLGIDLSDPTTTVKAAIDELRRMLGATAVR